MSSGFVVDLDGLADLVSDLGAFDDLVGRQVATLDGEMSSLHGSWTGEAATAQAAAHHRLQEALRQMRLGLSRMEVASRTAHSNYSQAVAANLRMLEGLG